jgi:hypothetical protein
LAIGKVALPAPKRNNPSLLHKIEREITNLETISLEPDKLLDRR